MIANCSLARADSSDRRNTVHTPNSLASEQNERFDKVEQMLTALEQRISLSPSAKTLGIDAYLKQVQIDENTKSLQACATAVFSSASTAAGRSISGATVLATNTPAFEFISEIAGHAINRKYQDSTTGSEYGEPLDPSKRSHMLEWIHQTTAPDAEPGQPVVADGSQSSRGTAVTSIFSNSRIDGNGLQTRGTSANTVDLFSESSDDGDLDFQVAERIFREAEKKTAAGDALGASEQFREGLQVASKLSPTQQHALRTIQMRICYARCCNYLDRVSAAEAM